MKIDVIIPAYNAHETLPRTLHSIAQQTIISDIDVTIADDCSERGYTGIIEKFAPYMAVREVRLDANGGPGAARQYGIDNTSNPLMTFIDADDTYYGAHALAILRKGILSDNRYHTCSGSFVEEHEDYNFVLHQNDMVWMFGRLYRRAFWERYNIRFNNTRSNEDTGVNKCIMLCSDEYEQVLQIPDTVYCWHYTPESITRRNNCEYSYNQSFGGYTTNMVEAIEKARKYKPYNAGAINREAVNVMCSLYEYYIETVVRDPRFTEQNWNHCQRFYDAIYRPIKDGISNEQLAGAYNDVMRGSYLQDKLNGIIPCMGLTEFLNKLEGNSDETDNQV